MLMKTVKQGLEPFICHFLKKYLDALRFPSTLEQGDITPMFNK